MTMHYPPPPPPPAADPHQLQGQAQGELQGQGQGQLQGQGSYQGQSQGQYAGQAIDTSVWNSACNENANENGNLNGNANLNGNLNLNDNINHNEVQNHVENTVDTAVNVCVNVDLGVDLSCYVPADNDAIDIDSICGTTNSIIMPDVVSQSVTNGNAFNLDQVSNLTDNDSLSNPSVAFNAGGVDSSGWCGVNPDAAGDFSMTATATGGAATSSIGDITGDHATQTGIGASTAAASLTQEAFTQHIAMGANIQFNQLDIHVAHDISDSLTG
ncbi:hypothetical protein [Bosea sp. TND4EK4]|uniref:hypothetical protein n=1 Tax=Bosea sp. TND4EK4 TaxID=1907408 RepID=UPI001FCE0419|nr:hypothetical protein [Bosea sp. TND4EK4]